MLAGPTGSGKTTMGLQFALEGVGKGEPALFVNFQENPTQLARAIRSLGRDFDQVTAEGLYLMYVSPVELQIDSLIVTMFQRAREQNIRRIVVDALGDLLSAASDRQRLHDYLYAMIQLFNANGITSVLILETVGQTMATPDFGDGINRFSFMSDNIVLLSVDVREKVKWTLAVLKARGTAQNLSVHEFEIAATGARIVTDKKAPGDSQISY